MTHTLRQAIVVSWTFAVTAPAAGVAGARDGAVLRPIVEISRAELLDRIHGGWVGMLIGGLEGLPHEFKYREEPRDTLPEFTL